MTLNGVQTALPVTDQNDESAAWLAFQELRAKVNAPPTTLLQTVESLTPDYLRTCEARGIQAKTIKSYASYLKWFVALFGNRAIADLDPVAIEREAARQAWSDSTRNNALTTVCGLVRWAGRNGFTLRIPAKESRGEDAVIAKDTYELLLRETRGDFHQYLRCLWHTGARPSEVLGLTADAIDWVNGSATLKRHKMAHKKKKRILHFNRDAMTVLREQLRRHETGGLFRGVGGLPLTLHAVNMRLWRFNREHGTTVTAYGFRHTFATRALASGESDTVVANYLGHMSTAMIHRNYSHIGANAALMKAMAERVG